MSIENDKKVIGMNSKIIFFILLAILLLPSLYFIKQSYVQLQNILVSINKPLELKTPLLTTLGAPSINGVVISHTYTKIFLEHDVMAYRHQRATALLATRTWMRFMSLIFGAILVVIGSGFVLGRIRSPAFTGELSFKEFGASIVTSSPGLLLVLCGIVLIAIPNLSNQEITIIDTSTYINKSSGEIVDSDKEINSAVDAAIKKYNL